MLIFLALALVLFVALGVVIYKRTTVDDNNFQIATRLIEDLNTSVDTIAQKPPIVNSVFSEEAHLANFFKNEPPTANLRLGNSPFLFRKFCQEILIDFDIEIFRHDRVYLLLGSYLQSQRIAIEIISREASNVDQIVETDAQNWVEESGKVIIGQQIIFRGTDCDIECSLEMFRLLNTAYENSKVTEKQSGPKSTVIRYFGPHGIRYKDLSTLSVTPSVLDLSYDLGPKGSNRTVSNLLEAVDKCERVRTIFIGAPGTGKTSLSRLVLEALGKKNLPIYLWSMETHDQIANVEGDFVIFVEDVHLLNEVQISALNNLIDGARDGNISFVGTSSVINDNMEALLRAGRMDAVVHLNKLTQEAAASLYAAIKATTNLEAIGNPPNSGECTLAEVWAAFSKKTLKF